MSIIRSTSRTPYSRSEAFAWSNRVSLTAVFTWTVACSRIFFQEAMNPGRGLTGCLRTGQLLLWSGPWPQLRQITCPQRSMIGALKRPNPYQHMLQFAAFTVSSSCLILPFLRSSFCPLKRKKMSVFVDPVGCRDLSGSTTGFKKEQSSLWQQTQQLLDGHSELT